MSRLSVARNRKLRDVLDLDSDPSRRRPCSTSAPREACPAWGTRSTAWVSHTHLVKKDRNPFCGRIGCSFTKIRSFKRFASWTTKAVMSVKSNVGAISQSFISWVWFPPPPPPPPPSPPPTCVCIRMEYLGPRLPYILSSNAHCTTRCTNVPLKEVIFYKFFSLELHPTMWIITSAWCAFNGFKPLACQRGKEFQQSRAN